MNIWSFSPEPVTDGPLKLWDTVLCLSHCGIYRRKRSNSSAQREHKKVNMVSWWFTCLEACFVSNGLTTNVWGQHFCTMFAFREMTVCFIVLFYLFFLLFFGGGVVLGLGVTWTVSSCAAVVCRKTFPLRTLLLACILLTFCVLKCI